MLILSFRGFNNSIKMIMASPNVGWTAPAAMTLRRKIDFALGYPANVPASTGYAPAAPDQPGVSFGGLLRQLRADAGLTQQELAAAASLSLRAVSDLERGVNLTARRETARLLADALGLAGSARLVFTAAARGHAQAEAFPASDAAAAATRTLPRDVPSFTGRQRELAQLADATAVTGGVAGILAIDGMAGIGKTAFAVHAAHRLAPRFGDGQLFLPLHGHTPGQRPVDPADALASLLLTVGIPAQQIPPGLATRSGLWRDQLAGKRVLLLLDDAADSEQVRPILPATAGSLVLVTSRRRLTALEDALAISLDTLPAQQAAALLVRLAARPGLDPGDPAIAEITALCGYLPLAVAMLARQLHHHSAWTPAGLAADLGAARDRLGLMRAENLSVTAAFDLSYQDLSRGEQRLFRRLGLHPGTDVDAYAAAALDGIELDAARRGLEALYDHHVLTEPARGRYRLHDLIREHARGLAAADPAADCDAALGRLLDYYQRTAASGEALLARQSRARPAPAALTSPPAEVPELPDRTRALSWARTERASLLACIDHATSTGQHARVTALTAAIAALLRHDGPWTDAITRHATAVRAARHLGDQPAEADALHELGAMRRLTGDYRRAAQDQEAALGIYRDLGDRLGQANALDEVAAIRRLTGDYRGASDALEAALGIYRDLGDRLGQANALHQRGAVRYLTGDYQGAAQAQEAALGIYRDLGDRLGQADVLLYLGAVRYLSGDYRGAAQAQEAALGIYSDLGHQQGRANALHQMGAARRLAGDHQGAADALEAALTICRDIGYRAGEANALHYLGAERRLTGDHQAAADALEAALGIYRDIGDPGGEVEVLNEVGALYRVRGYLDRAGACHSRALELARRLDSSWDEAHALAGLGRCAQAAGRTDDALAGLRQAWEIFQRTSAADAAAVAAELHALTPTQPDAANALPGSPP